MTCYEKIAVFDLDGTLWKYNSHIEILNSFYKTKFFTSVCYKALNKLFKKRLYSFICTAYERIPKEYVLDFNLPFDEEKVALLQKKKQEGFFVLIVSNAPYEICKNAAKRLDVEFIKAPIAGKLQSLTKTYSYDELFVCTDNIEDLDLIEAATEREIVFTKHNRLFFEKRGIYA